MKSKQSTNGKKSKPVRVVGIGASAGGLEALQQFFKFLPEDIDACFVVIQHLSPDYKSMMDELLARFTNMPIKIIDDGIRLENKVIYLIPPRHNLEITGNAIYLHKHQTVKGLNLPIDIFFRSLASEKGKDSIGVILSGTGSDGTMGTKAIKEVGGMVMVQDETTAKFHGMPSSAISTGLVDYILSPEEMGIELRNFLKHPLANKTAAKVPKPEENSSLSRVVSILKSYVGIDFSYYKENTIFRRLERRISINRFHKIEDYLPFLSDSDKEKDILFREFLIGVTHFFRDSESFKVLDDKVINELFVRDKQQIRVWTTGCSTGEEAYSIAILINEAAEKFNYTGEIKIFASDIDKKSIEVASRGFYTDGIIADIEPKLLSKYFTKSGSGYLVNKEIRNHIVFTSHNLLKDPPFSKLDLIVCRNLFIYLKPDVQSKLLYRFYYSLNPGGFLFMGSSETLGGMAEAFDPIDAKHKIYKYKPGFNPPINDKLVLDSTHGRVSSMELVNIKSKTKPLSQEDLMNSVIPIFLPPSIILNSSLSLVSVINNINPFIEIQPGNYSNEVFSLFPKDLGLFVSNLLRQMKSSQENYMSRIISGLENFPDKILKLEVRKIFHDETLLFVLSFLLTDKLVEEPEIEENDLNSVPNLRMVELEKELKSAKENLAATIEELESANEELQSSNEELIASNEELQSTNEELQSVNEELYTVNTEHQQKIEELTRLNNDVSNLLKNTEVAAIYLDSKLCIRKTTHHASLITNVLPSDVGRSITHLTIMPSYPQLNDDVVKVMDNLRPIDREIHCAAGKTFFSRIRPYRTENNSIEGVLITIVEITELDRLRNKLLVTDERLAASMQLGKMAWWEWNVITGEVKFNERKATMLGYTVSEFPTDVYKICDLIHPDDYDSTMEEMRQVLIGAKPAWKALYRMKRKDEGYTWYQDHGSIKSYDEFGKPAVVIGMVIDVSDMLNLENSISLRNDLIENLLEGSSMPTFMVNCDGQIIYANSKIESIFGVSKNLVHTKSFDLATWAILDINDKPITSDQHPFSLIKSTKRQFSLSPFQIVIENGQVVKLSIEGSPILSPSGYFEGAIFKFFTS